MKDIKKMSGKLVASLFVFMVILIVLYLITDSLIMPVYTRKWQKVNVPDVTRHSNRVALKLLKQTGLKMVTKEEKYDNSVPAGYVLFQNPGPGELVKRGRRIYLTVGKGHQVIDMPELIGISERDAKFIISQSHLELNSMTFKNDDSYPSGVVCEQSVAPGEKITMGDKVDLIISMGGDPNRIIVPDLIGKSREEALIDIHRKGLVFGGYEYQFTDQILPNTVLGQLPSAGIRAAKHDTVFLTISRLPEAPEKLLEGVEE